MRATKLFRLCRDVGQNSKGAVLVEFAIIAPVMLLFNLIVYDLATLYQLHERSQHAAQMIHQILANDSDHTLSQIDLKRMTLYRDSVLDIPDAGIDAALVVIDAMPLFAKDAGNWQFVVCWSWSSNPVLRSAPQRGSFLPVDQYPVGPWAPAQGQSASFANLIVEAHERINSLLQMPLLPQDFSRKIEGPVHYVAAAPINLMLYDVSGGTLQNDQTRRDPNAANAILCRR